MEHNNEIRGEESAFLPFDPIVVVRDVVKHWLLILLIALSVGVGAFILTDMDYEPRYQSQATFVVTTRGNSATVFNNLSSTSSLASVFSELINSSVMRKTILQAMDADSFAGTISAAAVPETNLLNITVTAPDPRTAFLVAQSIIDHHEEVTYRVVDSVSLEVLQGAEVATAPMNRTDAAGNMRKMFLLAGLAACALFALASLMRGTVRSAQEAKKKLDCSYLGEIPHENKYKTVFARLRRKKTSILITNPVTSFRFVETIRKLRRRVEQHMGGGKVLMVTSLLENEGKSTVAVNLGLAMAQKKKKVLLIDCDLRKPACHAVLDQKKFTTGIKEVLQGKASLSDSILHHRKSGMDMLLAHKGDRNTGDLITSERMDALLNWARENYDAVILDLPPMSAASDAEGMTALADACLLVIRQNVADASAINRSVAALENNKAKLLGCVLNNVYKSKLGSGGGYGYGYGYGSYHTYEHYGNYNSKD